MMCEFPAASDGWLLKGGKVEEAKRQDDFSSNGGVPAKAQIDFFARLARLNREEIVVSEDLANCCSL